MSYILDALQRAQAERGRGGVPGLHTPVPRAGGASAAGAGAARTVAWGLAALLLAAGLAGGVWWLWFRPPTPAAAVAAIAQAPVPTPVPAPVQAPASPAAGAQAGAPATAPAAPAPAPVPAVAPAPAPAAAAPPRRPAPPRQERAAPQASPRTPAQPPARAERRTADRPAAASGSAPASVPAKAPPPAPEAATPVFAQADLPPAVREQLPTLQLAGVTYSSNPLLRMVIVNGQVLHEGDQAAPGLVLERIESGRTVWAFRGYRYALPSR